MIVKVLRKVTEVLLAHPEVVRSTLERALTPKYIAFTPSGKPFSPKIIPYKGLFMGQRGAQ